LHEPLPRSAHDHDEVLHVALKQVVNRLREVLPVQGEEFMTRQRGRFTEMDRVELIPAVEHLIATVSQHEQNIAQSVYFFIPQEMKVLWWSHISRAASYQYSVHVILPGVILRSEATKNLNQPETVRDSSPALHFGSE
jgi:hypothetical protein